MACGGGGDDDGGFNNEISTAAYCDPANGWPESAVEMERQLVILVNDQRAAGAACGGQDRPPVPALSTSPELMCAARVHTLDMAERGYFSHTTQGSGEEPWDRMEMAGYSWAAAGENIAGGGSTPEATMDQWMNSPGHCNNIMSGDFTEIGVGHHGSLWTQVFARPR
ncbi:MAG: CAP domain-containing protein [Deltaproteobacteria bacterium]|nr:CAP domain-containing protein [Deltaproteobacteria bacterium]